MAVFVSIRASARDCLQTAGSGDGCQMPWAKGAIGLIMAQAVEILQIAK